LNYVISLHAITLLLGSGGGMQPHWLGQSHYFSDKS